MKLWHKIFFPVLFCVVLVVIGTTGLMLAQNFRTMIAREYTQAIERHENLSTLLEETVAFERLKQKQYILMAEEIAPILTDTTDIWQGGDGVAIYYGEEPVTNRSAEMISRYSDFLDEVGTDEQVVTEIVEEKNGEAYILLGSPLPLEADAFRLYTVADISGVYETLHRQLQFVRLIVLGVGAEFALLLILITMTALRPLKNINKMLQKIADGKYTLRLEKKGSYELRSLAENVNIMAQSIETSMAELQQISDGRKAFVDRFAHEMKTPLTSILGFADILRIKRDITTEQRYEYAGIIVSEAKHLKQLSGKLLELSVIEGAPLDLQTLCVEELFQEVAASVFMLLQEKGLALLCFGGKDVFILADHELMKLLFTNLIDNAAKASQPGQKIRLSCDEYSEGIYLTVKDIGVGMTEDVIAHAMEPFYQAGRFKSQKSSAGLGLSLCAEIVARHGFSMDIQSVPNEGTTVSIWIREGGDGM